jgi:hypothetical protein
MLVSMPSTLLGATFCFYLPTITWLLGGQPRFLLFSIDRHDHVFTLMFTLRVLMER